MSQGRSRIEPLPQRWLIGLAIACVLFVLAEFSYDKHGHTHVHYEEWFGFFSMVAIGVTALLALVSSLLRPVLRRDGSYYDE